MFSLIFNFTSLQLFFLHRYSFIMTFFAKSVLGRTWALQTWSLSWLQPAVVELRGNAGHHYLRYFTSSTPSDGEAGNKFVDSCPRPEFDSGCTYCKPEYPADLPVEFGAALGGTAPSVGRHVVVATGTNDWPSKPEFDLSSLQSKVRELQLSGIRRDHDFNFMITNSNLPPDPSADPSREWSVYLYPDNLYFPRLPHSQGERFFKRFLAPSKINEAKEFKSNVEAYRGDYPVVLICGHATRDARCGIAGPLLEKEFIAVLKSKGLIFDEQSKTGVRVAQVSHLSGHKYAGNVVMLTRDGTSIWYGLVQPENVQGIVKETIENGRIITELYRGGQFLHNI
ncbi:Sucrase/ferredoxin-like-domain-containing protein [Lipomyces japonicus]|uniref:Sucrase/ferredoxin-like-domain-containing protein n=1 Tax=Lipomyces japonicus TaxID=56871 RepID=UPI0034CFB8C7